jgi:large subunit ribosomal protein L21
MKYAILRSGGKQYLAQEGATFELDRLPQPAGEKVEFPEILLVAEDGAVMVGRPLVEGAMVAGRVVGHVRGTKVEVFKYTPKKRYRRRRGHRQAYSRVAVDAIRIPGRAETPRREATTPEAAPDRPAARPAGASAKSAAPRRAEPKKARPGGRASKTPARGKRPARKPREG